MTKSVKFSLAFFLLLAVAAACLLAYSVMNATKPLAIESIAAREDSAVPPFPEVGLPGAVAAEQDLLNLAPVTAKEINDSRPFSGETIMAARPFAGAPTADDGERAAACLATAGWYEAGADSSDQSAVMQVVLNRVRHRAFPNSVCEVVFQGSERRTGCQFSFTCDGSMARRRPAAAAWRSALGLARAMLEGHVDERVGLATHFHTDWVVPYWSAGLVKMTNVRTHLFFRWDGFWGTPRAFLQAPAAREPHIRAMASRFPLHDDSVIDMADRDASQTRAASASRAITDREPLAGELPGSRRVSPTGPRTGSRRASSTAPGLPSLDQSTLRRLDPAAGAQPGRWALDAVALCAGKQVCKVAGWSDPRTAPQGLGRADITAAPPDLVFVKVARDRREQAHWNCDRWPRASTSRCLGSGSDTVRLLFGE